MFCISDFLNLKFKMFDMSYMISTFMLHCIENSLKLTLQFSWIMKLKDILKYTIQIATNTLENSVYCY